jgi:hypothetical protein
MSYVAPGAINFQEYLNQSNDSEQPLSFDMIDESCVDYLNEAAFWGNRQYWHGSFTLKSLGEKIAIIDKVAPTTTNYEESYFSTHFGYSLTYALNLVGHRHAFKDIGDGNDLINGNEKIIEIDSNKKMLIQNSVKNYNSWMVLFRIQPKTRIFHAYDYNDLKVLRVAMTATDDKGNYLYPKMKEFVGTMDTDEFAVKMEPLKTIDWLDDIPKHFPFERAVLLKVIRNYRVGGNFVFKGYVNCEKGNFASIGLFREHLNNLLVGPAFQVIIDKNQLIIKRHNNLL